MTNEPTAKAEKMCFYQPGHGGIVDLATLDGRSGCFNHALEEIRAEYPGAVLMPLDEAVTQSQAANRARLCTGPKQVTEKEFDAALGVLPPRDWQRHNGEESFKIMELTCGQLTAIYCRIGEEYFTLTEDVNTPHEKIVEMCRTVRMV